MCSLFFFFKQKTAYEMRISDWSSDVCSSDLPGDRAAEFRDRHLLQYRRGAAGVHGLCDAARRRHRHVGIVADRRRQCDAAAGRGAVNGLLVLIPVALPLGLIGLAGFFWSLRRGQFDDLDGAALRLFMERSEERRVGKGGVSTCSARWSAYH